MIPSGRRSSSATTTAPTSTIAHPLGDRLYRVVGPTETTCFLQNRSIDMPHPAAQSGHAILA